MTRFGAHVRKEFLLLASDRAAIVVAILVPLVIVGLYGLLDLDLENLRFSPEFRETNPTALVLGLAAWLPSLYAGTTSLLRERDVGTLERLSVTPFQPTPFLLAKALVLGLFSVAQAALIVLGATLWVRAAYAPLHPLDAFWPLAATGLCAVTVGLLLATMVRSPVQGAQVVTLLALTSITFCGFFKPVSDAGFISRAGTVLPFTLGYQALRVAASGSGSDWLQVGLLALETVGFAILAAIALALRTRRAGRT